MILPARIDAKIIPEPNSGCWLWLGTLSRGYGRVTYRGKSQTAYRLVYELVKGSVPKGLELDHLCRMRCCVNPDHLEAVPHLINAQRGANGKYQLKRTHCPRGHEYNEKNTYRNARGHRWCRICDLMRTHRRRGKL